MSARIKPLEKPYSPDVEEILEGMMPPGIPPIALFRTLAVSPRILEKIKKGNLLDKGSISLREREIVIDRTTALCGSEYEWGVHISFFAQKAQLSKEQIKSLTHGQASDAIWTESERSIIRLVDALHEKNKVSDELWVELKKYFSDGQVIELVTLTGFYHTISFITNTVRIENEPGTPKFSDFA